MLLEDFIIHIYLIVEDVLQRCRAIRRDKFSDSEVITMKIVGEYFGSWYKKKIYDYVKTHRLSCFRHLESAPLLLDKGRICGK
ncbi:hypothetical protein P618_200483 [Holospora obtusa F1]|uniref:Uncharacterized protein n=1 Tax=Holospora obtusa F1 TaxID=1399147 RepID=W6TUA4_HOLOB|nr:hypothetical protein P618_200483 [Holospora obtusa F1]